MRCVVVAGGLETCISKETVSPPMPTSEIGSYIILWHIMQNAAPVSLKLEARV